MPENELLLGDVAYRNMGLIANPFKRFDERDPLGPALVSHAQACRLIVALDQSSHEDRPKPIWVEKSTEFADYFHTLALSEVLRSLARESTPVLGIYAPLDLFRLGRIRGALSMVAEGIAARQFDETLAAWAASALAAPDTSLPEYEGIAGSDLPELIERLQSQPAATIAEHFGPCVAERTEEWVADVRQRQAYSVETHLERDPDEAEATAEVDAELPSPVIGEVDEESDEGGQEEAPAIDPLAAYLIAHARAHISPVIARAVRGYLADGTASVTEQLKITKAPKKTLKALVSFATHRYQAVALLYDRFDGWRMMQEEARAVIAGTLSELRWLIADGGMLGLLVPEGAAPDLEEQFAGARKVPWDLHELSEAGEQEPPFDTGLMQSWIDAASLSTSPFTIDGPELAPLVDASERSLLRFAEMACAAIDDAASRGVSSLDAEAVAAGMRKGSE